MRYRRSLAVAHSQLLLHHRYDLILFTGSLPAFGNRVADQSRSRGSRGRGTRPTSGMWRPAIGPTSPAVPVSTKSALPFDRNRSDRVLRKGCRRSVSSRTRTENGGAVAAQSNASGDSERNDQRADL